MMWSRPFVGVSSTLYAYITSTNLVLGYLRIIFTSQPLPPYSVHVTPGQRCAGAIHLLPNGGMHVLLVVLLVRDWAAECVGPRRCCAGGCGWRSWR